MPWSNSGFTIREFLMAHPRNYLAISGKVPANSTEPHYYVTLFNCEGKQDLARYFATDDDIDRAMEKALNQIEMRE